MRKVLICVAIDASVQDKSNAYFGFDSLCAAKESDAKLAADPGTYVKHQSSQYAAITCTKINK